MDFKKVFKKVWEDKCKKYPDLPSILPPVKRIIVIGDIHGDYDMMIKSLKIAKVIDSNNNWIGGETVVVQVGDQIDRCRYNPEKKLACDHPDATKNDEGNDLKILKFFTALHNKALEKGGAVYSLIGNHELMNTDKDFRYVSYENLRAFDNYKKPDGTVIEDGREARKWAFEPGNPIANFLACTRQLSLIIGSNIFVHAGIVPQIAKKYDIEDMNKILSLYLLKKLEEARNKNDLLKNEKVSPLWTRTMALINQNDEQEQKEICKKFLKPLKKYYKVDKIFVGHTPQLQNGINGLCNNKIWLTDYGGSQAFDQFRNSEHEEKNIQVLEILDDGKEINVLQES